MSARDAVLGKIRKAVAAAPEEAAARRAVVERRLGAHQRHPIPGRVAGKDPAALKALLRQHLETALVTVLDVATAADIPAAVARYLRDQNLPQRLATGADSYIEELPWSSEPALTRRVGRARPDDEVGLSRAVAGVAETGTLALASGPDNPVTLTFLPETHIVIVEESAIVGPYENVWDSMRARFGDREMPRTVNFVSGPSRTADIGHFEVWHEYPERGDTSVAHHIALEAAHQQHREATLRQLRCRLPNDLVVILRSWRDDPGIPVPVKPTILAQTQVAHQAAGIAWTGAFRIVGCHCVDGLVERGEPVGIGAHEGDDSTDPIDLGMRNDIDQHDCPRPNRMRDRVDRRRPAERSADKGKGLIQPCDNRFKVVDTVIKRIGTGLGPVALAMPSRIEIDYPVTALRQGSGRTRPAVPGLPSAMEQDNHRCIERP